MSVPRRTLPLPVSRRDLVWGLGGLAGGIGLGMGIASIPAGASSSAQIPPPKVLQGKVLADPPPSGTEVSVQIGETVKRVAYQVPYVPVPGDILDVSVFAGEHDEVTLILGARSGRSGNLVVNGDFGRVPALLSKQPPYMWAQQRSSNRLAVLAYVSPRAQKPVLLMESSPEVSGDQTAYSAAFPVQQGDTIRADAATYLTLVPPLQIQVDLVVVWLAELDTPFNKGQLKTLFSRTPQATGEGLYEGQLAVPAGVKAARVGVRVRHNGGDSCQYSLEVGHVYAGR